MIEVYDSLSGTIVPLKPRIPGRVSIYTCGVTPYDHSHLGHARPAVVWDVIRRHLRRRGYIVTYVQNFTDIDDKIIKRAGEIGQPASELAARYMTEYHAAMEQLGVLAPDFAPRVTENIDAIISYIGALLESGHAYVAEGNVYFRVRSDPQYGQLSHRKLDEMWEGVRIEVEPGKEYAGDFALWKSADADEVSWPSPWGAGRPGWHIECSAMSLRYLGAAFDLHGGGIDLLFPHHENERAQSRAYLGHEPVSIWVHSGLITRGSVKMSKSLGNGISLSDLFSRFPAPVLRTYLLSVHYRSPLEFEEDRIAEWARALSRIERLWEDVKTALPPRDAPGDEWARVLTEFEEHFLAALDSDFNTAQAFARVFDMVAAANQGIARGHALTARGLTRRNLRLANEILGFLPDVTVPVEDEALAASLVKRRNEARQARDFVLADQLRAILTESGYEVLDGPEGTRWHRLGHGGRGGMQDG
ncbi:MAG: cysteine--tRNA ligase [Sulfobacillus acidophilus]|uniref:Cysteine--tRNA ligase n=1 Tax=Sulfobacillus acidophilus TaxID=53633 RepID=A0A2T2WIG8_9FIRM|nr:MAG: cysteine--tRNA ligase [Sulfobacillus acidophilus]